MTAVLFVIAWVVLSCLFAVLVGAALRVFSSQEPRGTGTRFAAPGGLDDIEVP